MNCRFSLKAKFIIILISSIVTYNYLYSTTRFTDEIGVLYKTTNAVPSKEFEIARRRILTETTDMWYYIQSELSRFANTTTDTNIIQRSKRILEEHDHRHRSVIQHLRKLSSMDGLGEWRTQEAEILGNIVQTRLQKLQKPESCANAKILSCNEPLKQIGYSYQIRHLINCLLVAYDMHRTMILSKRWQQHDVLWHRLFMPLGDTCDREGIVHKDVLELSQETNLITYKDHFPLAIPQDLSDRLIRLHGSPGVWWMGQMYRYLLRPNKDFDNILNERASAIDFRSPIIGVHVRRTDKLLVEASYHNLDDYMVYVENHFKLLELESPGIQRRVYLATDEPSVLQDARVKYPQYIIIGDTNVSALASNTSTRYSEQTFHDYFADINFLSRCDFLVCTFSSGVCRLAYALMQSHHPDASADVQSLDDIYWHYVTSEHLQRAVIPHAPRDSWEIELQVGDLIHVKGNFWNGSTDGLNKRTSKSGLYPSFKVEDVVNVYNS